MTAISIIEVFGAVVAALGGYEGVKWTVRRFFPSGSEKRQDEASTRQSEIIAEKSVRDMYEETLKEMREEYTERIKELRDANAELNKTNNDLFKALSRKEDIISDKVSKIRDLEEIRVANAKEVGRINRLLMFYKSWHCEREFGTGKEECKRRKPAQNPPIKFCPIDGDAPESTD